jgi:hypothetical protein
VSADIGVRGRTGLDAVEIAEGSEGDNAWAETTRTPVPDDPSSSSRVPEACARTTLSNWKKVSLEDSLFAKIPQIVAAT